RRCGTSGARAAEAGPARRASSREQQRGGDLALLGDQDVEGAASGLEVHRLYADARRRERRREPRMRNALARTGAEQDDLYSQICQPFKVLPFQAIKNVRVPR